jgi:hypothetical protein
VEGVAARIAAHPGPRPSISLGIEIINTGDREWHGTVFDPLVPWDLRAWVDGEEVAIRQPALDLAVRARRLRLAPGASEEIPSPIVLIFEGDEERGDAYTWVIGAPAARTVELAATVNAGADQLAAPRTTVELP